MIESAIPRAKSTASDLDCGLSFQFPVMKGFLANSSVVVVLDSNKLLRTPNCLLTNASVVSVSDKRKRAAENFIVQLLRSYELG